MPASSNESNGSLGPSGWFATTHWSVILTAGEPSNPAAAAALETLCRTYWYPVYAYVRRKGFSVEEAQDLTQDFFHHLLQGPFPAAIHPHRGKFRSYLLKALQHFLISEWRARQSEKRGSGRSVISWDGLDAESKYQLEPADVASPEMLYDRRWAETLLDRTRARLRQEYHDAGKPDAIRWLEPCLTGAEDALPYRELATRLGTSEAGVKMAVRRLRLRFGELLREETAQTVSSAAEVEEELRNLVSLTLS